MTTLMDLFSCVIETMICYFYLNGVLDGKKLNVWKIIGYYAVFLFINVIRSQCYLPFHINILVSFLMCWGLAILCFKGKRHRKFYFTVIEIIVIVVADMITALFLSSFSNIVYNDAEVIFRILGALMTNAFSFVIYIYVIYIAQKKYRQLPLKFNILMVLCPLVSIFLLMLLDMYIAQSPNPYYPMPILAVLALGYINVMVFNFFDYYEKGVRVTAMDTLLKANEENYKLLEANEKELHILRHDILKYAAEMKELVMHKDYDGANQYYEELNQMVRSTTCFARTGQLSLDTVLNIEGKKAIYAGIQYDLKLNIESVIKISSLALTRILSNAIDNAIEACELIEEKYILVSITVTEDKIRMTIENSSPKIELTDGHLKTTKADTKRHGYGIPSMREVVESYGGIMETKYKDCHFVCRIIINNLEKPTELCRLCEKDAVCEKI